jgi:hypothetical protein
MDDKGGSVSTPMLTTPLDSIFISDGEDLYSALEFAAVEALGAGEEAHPARSKAAAVPTDRAKILTVLREPIGAIHFY